MALGQADYTRTPALVHPVLRCLLGNVSITTKVSFSDVHRARFSLSSNARLLSRMLRPGELRITRYSQSFSKASLRRSRYPTRTFLCASRALWMGWKTTLQINAVMWAPGSGSLARSLCHRLFVWAGESREDWTPRPAWMPCVACSSCLSKSSRLYVSRPVLPHVKFWTDTRGSSAWETVMSICRLRETSLTGRLIYLLCQ